MKNTTYIFTSHLQYYNVFDVLFGPYVTPEEKRACYNRYAKLFGIRDKEQLNSYYACLSDYLIRDADTEGKFSLCCRALEFSPNSFSEEMHDIVNARKEAMNIKNKIAEEGDASTLDGIISGVGRLAMAGDVLCTGVLAFIKFCGIFVRKDNQGAIRLVRNAAHWNDLFANILAIKHDKAKTSYPSIIKAVLTVASQEDAYKHLERHLMLSEDVMEDPIAIALEKRFYSDRSSKKTIQFPIIDLINSTILTDDTKVALLDSAAKEPDVSRLPLNITRNTPIALPKKLCGKRFSEREAEVRAILSNFSLYTHSRHTPMAYKPLLLICRDEFVLDSFKQAILKSCGTANPILVDLKRHPNAGFTPMMENPIVSEMNVNGNASATVLIEGFSDLPEEYQNTLAGFLRVCARGELHNIGSLRFNYSGILPILFAATAVAPALQKECDVVRLAPFKDEDKSEFIRGIIDEKKSVFHLDSIDIDEDAIKSLSSHPLTVISAVIERVVSLKAIDGNTLITNSDITPFLPKRGGFEARSFWG